MFNIIRDYFKKSRYIGVFITITLLLTISVTGWVYLVANDINPIFNITKHKPFNLSGKSAIGDAVGGITAPIIGIISAILTFLAFYVQYDFNKEQMKRQNLDSKLSLLNHTFDLIAQKKIVNHDPTETAIFAENLIEHLKKNGHNTNLLTKDIVVGYLELKYSTNSLVYNEGINVYNQMYRYSSFLISLYLHHLKDISETERASLITDYHSKILVVLEPEYIIFYLLVLLMELRRTEISIEGIISDIHEDKELITRMNKDMTSQNS